MQNLSPRSVRNLAGVHPDLIRVIAGAMEVCRLPILVIEGVRTLQRQQELFAKGRTMPGPKVTDTMNSRHRIQASGFGCAVDIVPTNSKGGIDWDDRGAFDEVYSAMIGSAKKQGIELRSGMDWDRDGNPRERGEADSPHYELPAGKYP